MSRELPGPLEMERSDLLRIADRVPRDAWPTRLAPERWSVVDVLEHLSRVERGVARLLATRGRETPAAAGSLAGAQLDAAGIARVRDRTQRIEAPSRIQPTGAVTPEAALQALVESRSALREAYAAADPASLDGITHEHPVLGTLTLRGWTEFVAHHEARHAAQIAEIADDLRELA